MKEKAPGNAIPMGNKPPVECPDLTLEARMKEKRAAVIIARDNARLQLNGLENQLFVIDQLLNPPPDDPEKPPEDGVPMEDGKI